LIESGYLLADRFQDRFLKYGLIQLIDNKYFIKVNFAVWVQHKIKYIAKYPKQ